MSRKLDKRGRIAKRKVIEAEKRLTAAQRESGQATERFLQSLPARERSLLTGHGSPTQGIDRVSLLTWGGHLDHSAAARLQKRQEKLTALAVEHGIHIPTAAGSRPAKKKPLPGRFKTAFMAPGHEGNKAPVPSRDSMTKVGKRLNGNPIWRIVGKADTKPIGGK